MVVLSVATPPTASAADSYWGNSTGGTWNMSTNWTGFRIPSTGDAAYFARSSSVTYTVTADSSVDIAALAILDDRVRFDIGPAKQFKTGFALLGTAAGQVSHLEFVSGKFESYDVRVGHAAGSTGELVVDGSYPSYPVFQTYALYVGDAGHGALTMRGRNMGLVTLGYLAAKPGSSAVLSLSGEEASLSGEEASLSFTSLHVGGTDSGAGGTADVTIGPGGRLHAHDTLKVYDGSRIVLDGGILRIATDTDFGPSGLVWNEGRILTKPYTVGGQGLPSDLVLTDGQSLIVYDGVAKTTTIPAGTSLRLSGGSLTTDDIVMSGGTFAFDGGSLAITREVTFGADPLFGAAYSLAGGKGLTTYGARFNEGYHLDVADGSFTSWGEVFIHGNVTVAGGSFKLEGHLQEVRLGGSSATGAQLSLSGPSVFSTEREVYVGRGGNGSVAQWDSSAARMHRLYLAHDDSSVATYALGGSSTLETSDLYVGHSGQATLKQTGGTNTVLGDIALRIGEHAGSIGTYELSGGSLVVPNNAVVANLGSGTFVQSGGTFDVGMLRVGNEPGSAGTYHISVGTLRFKHADVGLRGTGVFIQTGGDAISTDEQGSFRIGYAAGSTGSYDLTDGTLAVRRIEVGTGGVGTFKQAGGIVTAGRLALSAFDTGSGSCTLDGGKLHLDNLWVHSNASFKQTGGELTLNGVTQFAGSIDIRSPIQFGDGDQQERFDLNGGTFKATALTVLDKGYLSVGDGTTFSVETLTQSGGSINGTVTNNGTFNYNAGAFLGRLINRGVANISGDFSTNGIENHASFSIPAGRTVTARQSGFVNDGPLDIQGMLVADQFALGLTRDGNFEHDAATIRAGSMRIGGAAGSGYVYNMTGGTLSANSLHVGHKGRGEFHVSAGATPETQSLTVGSEVGSEGVLTLRGTGSKLYVGITGSGGVTLGSDPQSKGRIDVAEGASIVLAGNATIGSAGQSEGVVNVSGAGSAWDHSSSMTVGFYGNGAFSLTNGARGTTSGMSLGAAAGSEGTLSIAGVSGETRSRLTVATPPGRGGAMLMVGAYGSASLTVADGALLDLAGPMYMGNNAGADGRLSIAGRTGNFDAEANIAGDLHVAHGDWTQQPTGGSGSIYVGPGGRLVTTGTTYLGLDKSDGTPIGIGRFELDGGYAETQSLYATDASHVVLRAGTLVLTDGSLDLPTVSLTLSAERAGESIRLRLRGNGSVFETGNLNVGGSDTAAGNAGRFDIEDSVSVRFSGETNLWPLGEINLAGGSLRTRVINRNGGTFNWTRGSLALTHSDLAINSPDDLAGNVVTLVPVNGRNGLTVGGTTTIGPGGTLTIDGGSFETGRLVVNDGGAFNFIRGSYRQTGEDLRVGEGGLFGKSLDVSAGRTVTVGSDTGPGRTLVIEPGAEVKVRGAGPGGGVLSVSSVRNDGSFVQEGGALTVRHTFINKGAAVFAGDHRWVVGFLNVDAGRVTLNSTMTPPDLNPFSRPAITISPGAHVSFGSTQRLRDLKVSGTSAVQPGKAVVIRTERLSFGDGAMLDLADGDLIVGASPNSRDATLAAVVAAIRSSRNAAEGLWKGPGLTSSAAAAAAPNGLTTLAAVINPGLTHFAGQPVGPHDVLVKYTYNGDANIDGKVNADDYFRIDFGFLTNPSAPTFAEGDFNYDGRINADDYFVIDSAFLGQGAPLGTPSASVAAAVPEPDMGCALATVAFALGARRRRRRLP